jgi:hypothetical protein
MFRGNRINGQHSSDIDPTLNPGNITDDPEQTVNTRMLPKTSGENLLHGARSKAH